MFARQALLTCGVFLVSGAVRCLRAGRLRGDGDGFRVVGRRTYFSVVGAHYTTCFRSVSAHTFVLATFSFG